VGKRAHYWWSEVLESMYGVGSVILRLACCAGQDEEVSMRRPTIGVVESYDWPNLATSTDAKAHREAVAHGLKRWHDFAESCIDRTGPAGVVNRGESDRLTDLRAQYEEWRDAWGSNLADSIVIFGFSRMAVATSHLQGLAYLLAGGPPGASVVAINRAWVETSARALWVLDPHLTAREAAERVLNEMLEDIKSLQARNPRRRELQDRIESFAEAAQFDICRDRSGRMRGIGRVRPDVPELLRVFDRHPLGAVFKALTPLMRRQGNAATHGGMSSYLETIMADIRGPLATMATTATSLIYGLQLHERALDALNSLTAWSPIDLLETSKRASGAGVLLASMQLDCAVRQVARVN
jgi:hypothetical protein